MFSLGSGCRVRVPRPSRKTDGGRAAPHEAPLTAGVGLVSVGMITRSHQAPAPQARARVRRVHLQVDPKPQARTWLNTHSPYVPSHNLLRIPIGHVDGHIRVTVHQHPEGRSPQTLPSQPWITHPSLPVPSPTGRRVDNGQNKLRHVHSRPSARSACRRPPERTCCRRCAARSPPGPPGLPRRLPAR